jgi:hypothetical protein
MATNSNLKRVEVKAAIFASSPYSKASVTP